MYRIIYYTIYNEKKNQLFLHREKLGYSVVRSQQEDIQNHYSYGI